MLNVWNSESGGHSSDPSSAANCVSLDSTKMIAAWRELSPHRHWRAGTLPCQPPLVTIVTYVNTVGASEFVYFTMLYSPWKIAKSLAFVSTF